MRRRLTGLLTGILAAGLPVVAAAQDERAIDAPADFGTALLYTLIGLGIIFLLAGIGYLYRRERNLEWEFQQPDADHDDHH